MDGFWSAPVLWFVAAAALLLAELAFPGFVLLFFALGACAAALAASLAGAALAVQVGVFLFASLAGLALLRRTFLSVFKGRSRASGQDEAALGGTGAGQGAVVTRAIEPGVPGEIKHRGSFWRAWSDARIGEGEAVVILGAAENDPGAYSVRPAAREGGQ